MIANFIGVLIFGSIGFVAFVYGRKMAYYRTMFIGLALMIYPYLVPANWALYAIGLVLTGMLIFIKG